MRIQIPEFTRCCFFVPLRLGIIIFGYLNLAFAIFVLTIVMCLTRSDEAYLSRVTSTIYRGVLMFTEVWIPIVLYGLEIIFNIVLIVGLHMKQPRLMKVYYYYGIVTTFAAFITGIYLKFTKREDSYWMFDLLDDAVIFAGLVLHIYLLLLIRTELSKLRYHEGQMTFVNHTSEVRVDAHQWDFASGRNPL